MKRAKLHAAIVGGSPDDLEHAFYEALQNGEMDPLLSCWAEEDDIAMVMSDGSRLLGHDQIRAGFSDWLSQGRVQTTVQSVHKIEALAFAIHQFIEITSQNDGIGATAHAMNVTHVYQKLPQGWRLMARHVSPCSEKQALAQEQTPHMWH